MKYCKFVFLDFTKYSYFISLVCAVGTSLSTVFYSFITPERKVVIFLAHYGIGKE